MEGRQSLQFVERDEHKHFLMALVVSVQPMVIKGKEGE